MKEENEKKVKKEKTIKQIIFSRIIFVLILTAIVVGVLYYLIMQNKADEQIAVNNEVYENTTLENNEVEDYKKVNLDGMYYSNPIKFTKKEVENTRIRDGIKYFEIDGLKNETLENKINEDIQNGILGFVDEKLSEKENTRFLTAINLRGNFANIISIEFTLYTDYETSDEYVCYNKYFNYNLIDGSKLKLEDVLYKSSITNILLEGLYNKVAQDYVDMDEDTGYLYQSEDSKYIEEVVYEIVSNYQRGKNFEFGISPSKLYVVNPNTGYDLNIVLQDYADYIIIYDRFQTDKELYDGKYEVVGPFYTLTTENYCAHKVLEQGENYFINLSFSCYDSNFTDEVRKNMSNYIDGVAEDFKNEVVKDENYFYVLNAYYSGYNATPDENGKIVILGYKDSLETTKIKFENSIFPKCLDFLRQEIETGEAIENYMGLTMFESDTKSEEDYVVFDNLGNIIQSGAIDPWNTED